MTERTERAVCSARPPNGSDVKLQAALPHERTDGAPLAAMHTPLTLSVCKRRDVVRLALNQPARPAGAAFGGLSASAASWAAPRHARASCLWRMGHCLFLGPWLSRPTRS